MRRILLGLVIVIGACGDDDNNGTTADAAVPAADANTAAIVERGRYLVENVLACGDCHTPMKSDGTFDQTRKLSGVECFADVMPATAGMGCINTRNLTNHTTGLMNRSNDEIKNMFLNGQRPGGTFLFPIMPWFLLHNMTAADADAIVAFLRTVPGVDHMVPSNEPPFASITSPLAVAAMESEIPAAGGTGATHDSAERGRYIAKLICIDCHTETTMNNPKPLNYAKAFQGGRLFTGLPSPPFPADGVYSANITPHSTGIMGYTVQDIIKELKMGKDKQNANICPPMPVGPNGPFGGLTDADATDIANYLLNLAPANNMIPHGCTAP